VGQLCWSGKVEKWEGPALLEWESGKVIRELRAEGGDLRLEMVE